MANLEDVKTPGDAIDEDEYESMMEYLKEVKTPCYVIDEEDLEGNLEVLDSVQERTGCKILLALKGFSMFSVFPLIGEYLHGVCASSLNEARLGFEEFGEEVHLYAPAYKDDEFEELIRYSDHIIFNSFAQWKHFRPIIQNQSKKIACGIRINPEHSEVEFPIYNPCVKHSRLGVTLENFEENELEGITGLHFHTLCEKHADSLARTLEVIEKKFGKYIKKLDWVNFGGGHLITDEDYDLDLLCELIIQFKDKYGVDVILEPGEAVAYDCGVLVASVLDIVRNQMDIAILDTSAANHMPDVLEMPYRPDIIGAGEPGQYAYTYRLGGITCLGGDVIGDYSFNEPLEIGSKIIFDEMAAYTMVKNNTFNGVNLPSIAICEDESGEVRVVREFQYDDFRSRLS
jgi:carboxynorspermidine decarboxylase